MKFSYTLAAFWANTMQTTFAHPGMARALAEIESQAHTMIQGRSTRLMGDLLEGRATTAAGEVIQSILDGSAAASLAGDPDDIYSPPGDLGSDECEEDQCCAWYYVVQDLTDMFAGCNEAARQAIRMGFHDAAAWDQDSSYGGADGSILLAEDELARGENKALALIGAKMKTVYEKYVPNGLGAGDLVQLAANTATVICPGGPRIRSFIGRVDDDTAAPTGLLPTPWQDAPSLIDMFERKTFTGADLVALVGAHSTSTQNLVDTSRAGAGQDSTPGNWDLKFYTETVTSDNKTNVLVFPSDKNLAEYSGTKATWNSFKSGGAWFPAYAQAYFRMSMLGVNNLNNLTECTRVLPFGP